MKQEPPQKLYPTKSEARVPYGQDGITDTSVLQDPHSVQVMGESGVVFINISDINHDGGHITEGGSALPAAFNRQEVLGSCLIVQVPVDV